ncbi:MAG: TauD/TfdA family dioxygenase [Pseudomonadales bacterium]
MQTLCVEKLSGTFGGLFKDFDLRSLVDVATAPDLTMRHSWAVGDIVMWDNRCVIHYAIHDYGDIPGEMHRVTVCGDRPS